MPALNPAEGQLQPGRARVCSLTCIHGQKQKGGDLSLLQQVVKDFSPRDDYPGKTLGVTKNIKSVLLSVAFVVLKSRPSTGIFPSPGT